MMLLQILEWFLLHFLQGCGFPWCWTAFSSNFPFLSICCNTAFWTTSLFSKTILWLSPHVKGVTDCLLDICHTKSLTHDWVAADPNRDMRDSGNYCKCFFSWLKRDTMTFRYGTFSHFSHFMTHNLGFFITFDLLQEWDDIAPDIHFKFNHSL